MPNLNASLEFLSKVGMFYNANRLVKAASFEELHASYLDKLNTENFEQASLIAKKASILYGLKGLYLFVPVELKKIEIDKEDGEIIDQALMRLLSLILFIEHNATSTQDQDWIKSQKSLCLLMCDSEKKRSDIEIEAEMLSARYPR